MSFLIPRYGARNGASGAARGLAVTPGPIDHLFDELWRDFHRTPAAFVGGAVARFVPQIDVTENDDAYVVRAELPGVEAEDVELVFEDGVLVIRGEKKAAASDESTRYRRAESAAGRFERRLRFRGPIDLDHIKASHRNGVLEVVLPKPEEAKPVVRTIPVETRDKAIDA